MKQVFVTGGAGFVGRRVIAELRRAGHAIVALDRSGVLAVERPAGVTVVRGDLLAPETYVEALCACDAVVHLAAATGRAAADEHLRVNALGTEALLDACRQARVQKFLFVSSIATTFKDLSGYPYAQAKLRAEGAVRRAGLAFVILRPTIILGPGAPVLGALRKLALLPVIILPGPGQARVQPIHVDDVARLIGAVVTHDAYGNGVWEIGGPEVLTIEALVRRLRLARTGRNGRLVHVPISLIRLPLRLAEAVGMGRALPITAGQLSSFESDGVAGANDAVDRLAPVREPLSAMLGDRIPDANDVPVATAGLDEECRTFSRHLLGCEPDKYVVAKYAEAHQKLPGLTPSGPVDRALIAVARVHPSATRVADAFAAVFIRSSMLRRKLVLLLAILETRAPFYRTIDRTFSRSSLSTVARLAWDSAIGMATLAAGILLLLPLLAVAAVVGRQRG